jgi:hypothetical protein
MASRREILIEILDLLVVTVYPSLSVVGSWEVLLFSMDFSVPELSKQWIREKHLWTH